MKIVNRWTMIALAVLMILSMIPEITFASESMDSIVQVQKYNRSIHIMAMRLVGFGFLMVFVRRYGRSALTATFLLVAVSLPLYISLNSLGIFGERRR